MILQVMAYNERRKKGRESKEEDKEVEEREEEEEEERPLKVSVELENPQRLGMEQFLPLADVVSSLGGGGDMFIALHMYNCI